MVPISVVIPVFRDEAALARTIDSTDFNGCELIVASTPDDRGPLALLRARRPDILWLETRRGRGARPRAAPRAAVRGSGVVHTAAPVPGARRLRGHPAHGRRRPGAPAAIARDPVQVAAAGTDIGEKMGTGRLDSAHCAEPDAIGALFRGNVA